MKTQIIRVIGLGLMASSLALGARPAGIQALAAEGPVSTNSSPGNKPVPAPAPSEPKSATESTPATALPAPASPKLVLPENLKISPALGEIVKLAQAGVSEDVLLTYITCSTNQFGVGADEIVFLNDLGVPSTVITTLIQHDASPEALARKQAAESVKPLSPELTLNTPATNIYPTRSSLAPVANYYDAMAVPEPAYVNPPLPSVAVEPGSAANYFYNSLAPYGIWIEVPGYGLCWQPTVAVVDTYWRPYADGGRWYWTDAGWYWHSYYSWGWAPFHYGRWYYAPVTGWVWIPDTCWGPAWVTWRYTPYYCGWAPLPPRCQYVQGFGLYYNNSSVSVGFDFGFDYDQYTWIPNAFFCDAYPHHYYVATSQARTIFNQSTPINNVTTHNGAIYNHGIGLERIARVSRSEIRKVPVRVEPMPQPGAARFERFQNEGGTPVLVRPRLPQNPPSLPGTNPAGAGTPPRSAPTPSRRTSLESDRQATALLPSASRDAPTKPAPKTPGAPSALAPPARQGTAPLPLARNEPAVTPAPARSEPAVTPPSRREAVAVPAPSAPGRRTDPPPTVSRVESPRPASPPPAASAPASPPPTPRSAPAPAQGRRDNR